jgi:HAD superfamily hydrolase (TIGR01509 family)
MHPLILKEINVIKAVLFDMDGVLVDARDWHYEALNRILDKFGMAIDMESHLSTYDGLPTKVKLAMLYKTKGLPQGLHTFINEMKQRYTAEMIAQKCKPVFHIQRTLTTLKREHYKVGVCSNSVNDSVVGIMRSSGLTNYLDIMLSNESVKKAKPDPEIYVAGMKMLDVSPAETLIVEDNEHGLQAAYASGAHVLKVADPSQVTLENIRQKIAECH